MRRSGSGDPATAPGSTGPAVVVAVATLLGAALRFVQLGDAPLWLDENATYLSLQHLWRRGADAPVFVQASNLLYYALLSGWTGVFGESTTALRALSAAAGSACIPLGAALAQRIGGASAARIAAVVIALHPLHLHYSREARAYALWTLLLLAATALLWRAQTRGDRASWLAAGLAWIAAFGAHVFTLFALPATAATVLWAEDRRSAWRSWGAFAIGVSFPCVAFAFTVLQPALDAGAGAWLAASGDWQPWRAPAASLWALLPAGAYPGHLDALSLASGRAATWAPAPLALAAAAIPVAISAVAVSGLPAERGARDWRPLAVLALGPLALQWIVSWWRPTFLAARYDLVAWPALTLWIALGVTALGRAAPRRATIAVGLLAACAAVPAIRELRYDGDRFDSLRAERLTELTSAGDLVISFSNDDDAMAHALARSGFDARLRPFPGWLSQQIAFLDSRRDLSPERARALAGDAAALEHEIRAAWADGANVLWLGDALRLDGRGARATLPERLDAQLRAAGVARVPLVPELAIDRLEPARGAGQAKAGSASPAK